MLSQNNCASLTAFRETFKLDELTLVSSQYWVWSLHPQSVTLGAGILSLKRFSDKFAAITDGESRDLVVIARIIEQTIDRLWGPERFNYLMLMMRDPQVHYHVLPRYAQPVEFFGQVWQDTGYPAFPVFSGSQLADDILAALKKLISETASEISHAIEQETLAGFSQLRANKVEM